MIQCGYSFREDVIWVTSTSPAADRGTRFHKAIASYVAGVGVVPDADFRLEYEHATNWVDAYGIGHLRAEVAFAWDHNSDTATELAGVDRDYRKSGGRLAGTADLVSVNKATRSGYVGDFKTGDGSGATMQLRALALMLARTHDLDVVTVEALEASPFGIKSVCREVLDAFDLAAVAGELSDAIESIDTAQPTPGAHCTGMWCNAVTTCPVGHAAAAELVPVTSLVRYTMSTAITSPDHAAWMLDRVRLVEAACKAVKEAVKEACPPGGWALEDGSVLREGSREVPRFDKTKAIELARAKGATDEEIAACTYTYVESSGLRRSAPAKRKVKAA